MRSSVLVFGVKQFALGILLILGVFAAHAQVAILPSDCSNRSAGERCATMAEIIGNPSEPEVVTKLVQQNSCDELSSLWAWYNDGYWNREDEYAEQSRLLAYLEESGEGEGETARALKQELAELSQMRGQHQIAWHRVKLAANIKGCDGEPVRGRDALDDFLGDAESTFSSERRSTTKTARLDTVFYSQIYPCWDNVVDLPNPETLNVRLQVSLTDDGSVSGIRLLEPAREPLGRSPMRVAIERARRAVQKCAPYQLPRQDYALWQTITVSLGPRFGDVLR